MQEHHFLKHLRKKHLNLKFSENFLQRIKALFVAKAKSKAKRFFSRIRIKSISIELC